MYKRHVNAGVGILGVMCGWEMIVVWSLERSLIIGTCIVCRRHPHLISNLCRLRLCGLPNSSLNLPIEIGSCLVVHLSRLSSLTEYTWS